MLLIKRSCPWRLVVIPGATVRGDEVCGSIATVESTDELISQRASKYSPGHTEPRSCVALAMLVTTRFIEAFSWWPLYG